jgi:hypothetical protein
MGLFASCLYLLTLFFKLLPSFAFANKKWQKQG